MQSKKKKRIIAGGIITALLAGSLTVYAWFSKEKKLTTLTMIQEPTMLVLTSGNTEDIERFYLGDINVMLSESNPNPYRDYVFGVYSEVKLDYELELAYTQNIPFEYSVFKTSQVSEADGDILLYTTESGEEQYYDNSKETELKMNKFFSSEEDAKNATYGEYSNIQSKAIPEYLISEEVFHSNETGDQKGFTDYYILHVNWEKVKDTIKNDRETDMIYIIVSSEYSKQ